MKLYGYSERGLVNALCYDCLHSAHGDKWIGELLSQSHFPSEKPDFAKLTRGTLLVEQSLSEFGESDLIVLCDWKNGDKAVVFCEFKRRGWTLKKEWHDFTLRIQNEIRENLTSNLFCQLYFKQRFCQALGDPAFGDIYKGLVFAEPLNTRSGDGSRKIGENHPIVPMVVELIKPYAKTPYFLMVVPEAIEQGSFSDFLGTTDQVGLPFWTTKRWGHLSLRVIRKFCEDHRPTFDQTLLTFDFNGPQLL